MQWRLRASDRTLEPAELAALQQDRYRHGGGRFDSISYKPAWCYFQAGTGWRWGGFFGPSRPAAVLTANASVCGTAASESIVRVVKTLNWCFPDPSSPDLPRSLQPFSNGAFKFWISGGNENDKIMMEGSGVICGGDGNDTLIGGSGTQYIVGEGGNDYVEGRGGYDNIRGSIGNDVLVHNVGPDATRYGPMPTTTASCSGTWTTPPSRRAHRGWTGTWRPAGFHPPPECESAATETGCCTGSGRHCHFDMSISP